MWLISPKRGFVSAVAHRKKKDTIILRARAKDHLVDVLDAIEWEKRPRVWADNKADYRWRTMIPKAKYVEIAAALAAEVDYPNVKSAAARYRGRSFEGPLHNVWSDHLVYDDRPGGHPWRRWWEYDDFDREDGLTEDDPLDLDSLGSPPLLDTIERTIDAYEKTSAALPRSGSGSRSISRSEKKRKRKGRR